MSSRLLVAYHPVVKAENDFRGVPLVEAVPLIEIELVSIQRSG